MEKRISYVMDSYELGRLLGQGSFAKVYHGRSIKTGQHVAIKVIDKEKVMRVGLVNRVKREISVMRMMRHPNIVQLYEVMATRTKIYFVMEYAKGGELFNKLTKGRLKEDVAQNYFHQLINAVECCHCKGVYHRDLKPENLLLDDNEVLKVTDFGLSALCESKRQDGLLHTTCGTPAYVAPEVISRKGYDGAKADLWSCGVILYVLLAGYLPFSDTNLMELYRKIGQAEFNFPKWFSEDVCQLLLKLLEPNPEVRISIAEIKENPWFRKDFKKESQVMGVAIVDQNADVELKQELIKPTELNAFDIVALSSGFNLSGLFAESDERKEKKREMFTSRKPASVIISRLIETARRLRFKVKQIDKGLLNFEVVRAGKRRCLSIDAEIFEFTPTFYMVEMRKTNGDSLQYEKTMKEDIRPALQDIVWSWQSEQKQSHLLHMHH